MKNEALKRKLKNVWKRKFKKGNLKREIWKRKESWRNESQMNESWMNERKLNENWTKVLQIKIHHGQYLLE